MKWKPGDRAMIMPTCTPCEIDSIADEMHLWVWVPCKATFFMSVFRLVAAIELTALQDRT